MIALPRRSLLGSLWKLNCVIVDANHSYCPRYYVLRQGPGERPFRPCARYGPNTRWQLGCGSISVVGLAVGSRLESARGGGNIRLGRGTIGQNDLTPRRFALRTCCGTDNLQNLSPELVVRVSWRSNITT